jgi:hypothetical protein
MRSARQAVSGAHCPDCETPNTGSIRQAADNFTSVVKAKGSRISVAFEAREIERAMLINS